jgi:hypothetical protein
MHFQFIQTKYYMHAYFKTLKHELVVNTKLGSSATLTIGADSSASLPVVCNSKQCWHLSSFIYRSMLKTGLKSYNTSQAPSSFLLKEKHNSREVS